MHTRLRGDTEQGGTISPSRVDNTLAREAPTLLPPAPPGEGVRRNGLDSSTDAFVGRVLFVAPLFGNGWDALVLDEAHRRSTFVVPPPFHVRLVRIWTEGGERRGGVAQVTEEGHPYDKYWLVFATRHEGMWNFSSRMGVHNITIGPEAPGESAPGRPVLDRGAPRLTGYAEIRVTM